MLFVLLSYDVNSSETWHDAIVFDKSFVKELAETAYDKQWYVATTKQKDASV